MIYDLFAFSHEVSLLEIRLEILKDIVDKFVIYESDLTHTNISKPLFFLENKSRFDKFKDKIIYVTGRSNYENPFYNDWAGRCILFQAIKCKSDDIIIHSDLDEIPNPVKLKEIIEKLVRPITLKTDYNMYCVDLYAHDSIDAIIMKYDWIKDPLYKYRDNRGNYHVKNYFNFIEKAGWHYGYSGGIKSILRKVDSFAHSNEMPKELKNEKHILECIKQKKALHYGAFPNSLKKLELNKENIPEYILSNKDKYKEFFSNFYE